MQRLGIQLKMAFAVAVRDSFSGRPLTGSQVRVSLPEDPGNRPVTKRDGYYVVLAGRIPVTRVLVQAPGFHSRECMVDPETLEVTGQILYVWLVPDQTYAGGGSRSFLQIRGALPGEPVTVTETGRSQGLRILSLESGEKTLLRIFSPGQQDLSGRSFAVMKSPEEVPEQVISLLCREGEDSYVIKEPVAGFQEGAEAYLYPRWEISADRDGNAAAVLKPDPDRGDVSCAVQNRQGRCIRVRETDERILRIDLSGESER